jgi:septum site-determining protein MinD
MARVYTVASIKGGVGKTTIAGNLGILLARLGKRTLLIDADLAMGGLSTTLGVGEAEVTLHDLLAGKGEIEKVVREVYGAHVLPSGPSLRGFLRADPNRLRGILDEVSGSYDFIIIDTPPGLSKYSLTPMKLADEILLIVTPDISAIRAAEKLEEVADLAGAKVGATVVNRIKKPSFLDKLRGVKRLKRAEIQRRIKSKIVGAVPEDPAVPESANLQKPVVIRKPKSPASKALLRLARTLSG